MSNGKGSNTAKRTNFKKFNEGWDKIDWGNKETKSDSSKSVEELMKDAKDKLEQVKENEHLQSQESGSNTIG
jgi:hypothetical protein